MFSFAIGAFVCFGVVFHYAIFWFVAGSAAIAASLGVSAVYCHMTKAVTLEALGGFGVALEELAVVGLVAPVNLLSDHFIRMFWFADGDKERTSGFVACEGFFLKRGFEDSYSGFL